LNSFHAAAKYNAWSAPSNRPWLDEGDADNSTKIVRGILLEVEDHT
jgi:hypothetical protein